MSEHTLPQNQDSIGDEELSTQELEDVTGGADVNGNCPCPITNNGCDTAIDN